MRQFSNPQGTSEVAMLNGLLEHAKVLESEVTTLQNRLDRETAHRRHIERELRRIRSAVNAGRDQGAGAEDCEASEPTKQAAREGCHPDRDWAE